MAAVQQNGLALQYVEEQQTEEVCMAAVKQHPSAIKYILYLEMRKKVEEAMQEEQASELSIF